MQKTKLSFFIFLSFILPNILIADTFQEDLKFYLKKNVDNNQKILSGDGNWLQLRSNLNFISHDEFWGATSKVTSKARDLSARDPLSAILDFDRKLKIQNIKLILVPIPVKTSLYPEKLLPKDLVNKYYNKRFDSNLKKFIKILKENEVTVVDLHDILKSRRYQNVLSN